jgi:hypothetical protein
MNWLKNLIRSICAEMMKVHGVSCFVLADDVPRTDLETTKFKVDPPTEGDPDGFYVVADDSGVITIPIGLPGMYIVHAWIHWEGNGGNRAWTADDQKAGGFYSFVKCENVDGQLRWASRDTAAAVPGMYKTFNHTLWEGQLSAGDTIEVFCQQNVTDTDEFDQQVEVRASGVLTVRRLGDRA